MKVPTTLLRLSAAILTTLPFCTNTMAQSTTVQRGSATTGSTTYGSVTRGSAMQRSVPGASKTAVAMQGYCPVCILEMKKWVRGNPNFSVQLDGKLYLFPGEEQRQMFLANTTKYTPALGGNCVVCALAGGDTSIPGSVHFSAIHEGRLYLFPSENEKAKFMADPRKYENVDLAFGGMCSVCRVEMNQEMPGKSEFGTVFGGKRYYFPGQDQKKMFLANPKKYAESESP